MTDPLQFRYLDDWLPWLEMLSPREIVLGLDRVATVMDRLALQRPRTVINVGGTNGKGSSVAMLEALLAETGLRTGCYTSPHIRRYNERTRIDRAPAADDVLIEALRRVEQVREDVPLTFFEFGTLATLVAFSDAGLDAWILEVGLGGRLDAVNAVDPDASLITNVSLDHCAWLGDNVEAIAAEKAGIMRAGKPVVFGARVRPAAIERAADEIGARLIAAGAAYTHDVGEQDWRWCGVHTELDRLPLLSLEGRFQYDNAAAALAVVEALELDGVMNTTSVSTAFSELTIAARFQRVGDRWVLDVAHNPAAGQALGQTLAGLPRDGERVAIIGMLQDKDVGGFVAPFADQVDRFVAIGIDVSRGQSADATARALANAIDRPCLVYDSLEDALQDARDTTTSADLVLVTGSFYIVGPAFEWLQGQS